LPIFVPDQFSSIETDYFVTLEYNSLDVLKEYTKLYPKIYDFIKLFNVRAVAVESTSNKSKVEIYKKSSPSNPLATYGNEVNNTDELIDFINVETLPLLVKLNDENYVRVFGSFLDVSFSFILDSTVTYLRPNELKPTISGGCKITVEVSCHFQSGRIVEIPENIVCLRQHIIHG